MKYNEYYVTMSVVKYLKSLKWKILSINNPFAGKSITIKPLGGYRGKGSLIPDIIARKEKVYLIIESYERLKIKDIVKLNKYELPEYYNAIRKIFKENEEIKILKGLAYPAPIKIYNYPNDLFLFILTSVDKIILYIGNTLDNNGTVKKYFISTNIKYLDKYKIK